MSKISLLVAEATAEQLTAFAVQSLGLEIKDNTPLPTLRAKIKAAWAHDDFTLDVATPAEEMRGAAPEGSVAPVPKRLSGQTDPKVRLTLHKHERAGGDRAEFVAVNGVGMMIPRGEPCYVPYRYFEVLQNAVETHYIDDADGNRMVRKIPAFQFSILEMPDQRAIDDYVARTAKMAA